jgi:hypothetical protein
MTDETETEARWRTQNGPRFDLLAGVMPSQVLAGEPTGFLMAFGRGPVFPESSQLNNLGQSMAETTRKYGCFDHKPYVDISEGHQFG